MLNTVEVTVRTMLDDSDEIDFSALVDKLRADDAEHGAVRYTTTKVIALLKEVESTQTEAWISVSPRCPRCSSSAMRTIGEVYHQ